MTPVEVDPAVGSSVTPEHPARPQPSYHTRLDLHTRHSAYPHRAQLVIRPRPDYDKSPDQLLRAQPLAPSGGGYPARPSEPDMVVLC